jgi:hypothetical protein
MDKIIKLPSVQGFSFTKDGAATTADKSLLDFVIPSGDVYNLRDSHININVSVDAPDGDATAGAGTGVCLVQFGVLHDINTATSNNRQIPNVSLVKNCFMESQNAGMIESIRRVNTLRCLLESVETDFDNRNSLDYINAVSHRDENVVAYSPVRDVVKINSVAGTVDATQTTRTKDHDIKIPLKDIFNFCKVSQFDSGKYGNTKVHLEMDLKRLTAFQILGATDKVWNDTNNDANKMDNSATAGAGGLNVIQLVTEKDNYKSENESPYYIGQKLSISATGNNGAGNLAAYPATITAIEHENNDKLTITLNRALTALANTQFYSNIRVVGVDAGSITININHAELVLKSVLNPVNVPSEINYTSYSVEEDNGNNLTNFNRQYIIEPEASSLIVALPNTNDGLVSNKTINHYRIRINNIDQTQRDINNNSPLHQDRILRFCENRNKICKNISEKIRNIKRTPNRSDVLAQAIGSHLNIVERGILEPLPLTNDSKLIGLEINSGGLGDIILYKQVLKKL